MKQQDVAVLIVIIFVAGVGTFFAANAFIKPEPQNTTAEVVEPINSDFPLPSTGVFNTESINPTVPIQIAPNTNNQPFAEQQN